MNTGLSEIRGVTPRHPDFRRDATPLPNSLAFAQRGILVDRGNSWIARQNQSRIATTFGEAIPSEQVVDRRDKLLFHQRVLTHHSGLKPATTWVIGLFGYPRAKARGKTKAALPRRLQISLVLQFLCHSS